MPVRTSAIESEAESRFLTENPNAQTAVDQLPQTQPQDSARVFIPNGDQIIGRGWEQILVQNRPAAEVWEEVTAELEPEAEAVWNNWKRSKASPAWKTRSFHVRTREALALCQRLLLRLPLALPVARSSHGHESVGPVPSATMQLDQRRPDLVADVSSSNAASPPPADSPRR